MKEKLLEEIKEFLKKLVAQNIPAMFVAVDGENFIEASNCDVDTQAKLIVNKIDSSGEMQVAFTNELQLITEKELKEAKENG